MFWFFSALERLFSRLYWRVGGLIAYTVYRPVYGSQTKRRHPTYSGPHEFQQVPESKRIQDRIHPIGNCFLKGISLHKWISRVPILPASPKFSAIYSRGLPLPVCGVAFQPVHGPRVLCKVLAPALGLLRTKSIAIVGYLNDLLPRDQSIQKLTLNVSQTV